MTTPTTRNEPTAGELAADYTRAWHCLRRLVGLPDESPDGGRDLLERVKVLRDAENESACSRQLAECNNRIAGINQRQADRYHAALLATLRWCPDCRGEGTIPRLWYDGASAETRTVGHSWCPTCAEVRQALGGPQT